MMHPKSVRGPLGGWEQIVTRDDKLVRMEMIDAEIVVLVETANCEELARAANPFQSRLSADLPVTGRTAIRLAAND